MHPTSICSCGVVGVSGVPICHNVLCGDRSTSEVGTALCVDKVPDIGLYTQAGDIQQAVILAVTCRTAYLAN
jgi:hypothetical protein